MFRKKKNKKHERTHAHKLPGLSFQKEGTGIMIIDNRNITKPRTIGLILRKPFSSYYMLCPFVQRGLYFDLKPASNFRTPERAQTWLERHAVAYNDNRVYTPFNPFAKYILSDKLSKSPLTNIHFQLAVTQLLLAGLLIFYLPIQPQPAFQIGIKGIGVSFFIAGIFNFVIFIQNMLQ